MFLKESVLRDLGADMVYADADLISSRVNKIIIQFLKGGVGVRG
jgi:hypothetical protein